MTFDLVKFINEAYASQDKYALKAGEVGPTKLEEMINLYVETPELLEDFLKVRHSKVIEHLSHMIEETIEARMHVPRRSWKTSESSFMDSEEARKEFITEMYDILLFYRAVLAYAGVKGEELAEIAHEKNAHNSTRKDHAINV